MKNKINNKKIEFKKYFFVILNNIFKNEPMKLSKPAFLKMSPTDPLYRTQGPVKSDFMNYWCKLYDIRGHNLAEIIKNQSRDFKNVTLWAEAVEKDLESKIKVFKENI